jgi:hypothetical protein
MSEQHHLAVIVLVPSPGSNSSSSSSGNGFTLSLATVDTIEAAVQLTQSLVTQGVNSIELSSGFGDEGLAAIQKAAGTGIDVARVRS